MEKIKSIAKRLLKPDEKLPQIINKSRIFNTYVSLIEIALIVFWAIVPGRTNQQKHILQFVATSCLNIAAVMYVHVNYRIKYFSRAIMISIASLIWIFILMFRTI